MLILGVKYLRVALGQNNMQGGGIGGMGGNAGNQVQQPGFVRGIINWFGGRNMQQQRLLFAPGPPLPPGQIIQGLMQQPQFVQQQLLALGPPGAQQQTALPGDVVSLNGTRYEVVANQMGGQTVYSLQGGVNPGGPQAIAQIIDPTRHITINGIRHRINTFPNNPQGQQHALQRD